MPVVRWHLLQHVAVKLDVGYDNNIGVFTPLTRIQNLLGVKLYLFENLAISSNEEA